MGDIARIFIIFPEIYGQAVQFIVKYIHSPYVLLMDLLETN